MGCKLLKVEGLRTYFFTRRGVIHAVDGVSFSINRGEVYCLVGESGCGKSVTALSIMRLVPFPGKIVGGRVIFEGSDLLELDERELCRIRGSKISVIFQDPNTSLNPVFTVGFQVDEAQILHSESPLETIKKRTISLFRRVGIPRPKARREEYPHQFSGGMKQRVMLSMAISNSPRLLIADEPTTALDVTIQARLAKLLMGLKDEMGLSILLITHNLGLVAETGDRVGVMYAGKIVEEATVYELFDNPLHPYTRGLMSCIPRADRDVEKLETIPGQVPVNIGGWKGCMFRDRCRCSTDVCTDETPRLVEVSEGHAVRCHLHDKR